MTAGQFVDRLLNAAIVKAGEAANKLMELSLPAKDGHPMTWTDVLASLESTTEVLEPHQISDISGCPPAVEDVGSPAGAGSQGSAPRASAAGTGGHPDRDTSVLLEIAADFIDHTLKPLFDEPTALFVAELRDRAASFAAYGD